MNFAKFLIKILQSILFYTTEKRNTYYNKMLWLFYKIHIMYTMYNIEDIENVQKNTCTYKRLKNKLKENYFKLEYIKCMVKLYINLYNIIVIYMSLLYVECSLYIRLYEYKF